ncbi:MAG: alpha-E domain-containing protein [Anaerolineae bacterium]|nr:alpha-E domain-containing protein [Anaerolineae bacterium]
MLSRVAESLYWMSRYLERAEDMTRIIAVTFQASLDAPTANEAQSWARVISTIGDHTQFAAAFDKYNAATVTEFLTRHPANPNTIFACIQRARENARAVREQISREMWEQVNRLYHLVRGADLQAVVRNPYDFFSEVRNGSHLFQGVTDATMTHGEGWYFIQVGKYLERADKTARILDVQYNAIVDESGLDAILADTVQWVALLRSCSAFEPYRRSHSELHAWRVADFLLLDRAFPRSVLFCLEQTRRALALISGHPLERPGNAAERALGRLYADLTYLDLRDALGNLHGYLDELIPRLAHLGDAITQSYFTITALPPAPSTDRYRATQQQQQQ